MPYGTETWKFSRICSIKKHIKDNPSISMKELIIKCQVNSPFMNEKDLKKLLIALILDKQVIINQNEELNLPNVI